MTAAPLKPHNVRAAVEKAAREEALIIRHDPNGMMREAGRAALYNGVPRHKNPYEVSGLPRGWALSWWLGWDTACVMRTHALALAKLQTGRMLNAL